MEQEYQAPVFPLNCKQMKVEDVSRILEGILYEFPVTRMDFFIPKWTEMLPMDHKIKQQLIRTAGEILSHVGKMRDVHGKVWNEHLAEQKEGEDYLQSIQVVSVMPDTGTVALRIEVPEAYYFENISEMTGVPIEGEYQMISMIRDLAAKRREYEKVQEALLAVQQKGYGVVLPELSDISMEDPVLISHGNRFGVKMKAISPSIHMIRANVETEIAPIVGSREQAEDLIAYIKEGEESKEGIWTTNIFGKSLGDLMEDGIRTKITQMDDECQMKLQDTMQKIVNDSNGGMICIII
jgi:stage IV sporulation protein A